MFKIGDTIEINRVGKFYTTFSDMAMKMKLDNYRYDYLPNCDDNFYVRPYLRGKIVDVNVYDDFETLYGVRLDNNIDIIVGHSEDDLKLIRRCFKLPDDLFNM